mmetsp:Transcript_71981/g.168545  ORF Transcript_71981/g.168545 Transcript_71981/m.168545 type:complete len:233 (+) Transcript_71981:627-1325(+)
MSRTGDWSIQFGSFWWLCQTAPGARGIQAVGQTTGSSSSGSNCNTEECVSVVSARKFHQLDSIAVHSLCSNSCQGQIDLPCTSDPWSKRFKSEPVYVATVADCVTSNILPNYVQLYSAVCCFCVISGSRVGSRTVTVSSGGVSIRATACAGSKVCPGSSDASNFEYASHARSRIRVYSDVAGCGLSLGGRSPVDRCYSSDLVSRTFRSSWQRNCGNSGCWASGAARGTPGYG